MAVWTLIFTCEDGSAQSFIATSEDPSLAGQRLREVHAWLADYALVAAVQGRPTVRLRDDTKSRAECALEGGE